jgi:hypothetical protein
MEGGGPLFGRPTRVRAPCCQAPCRTHKAAAPWLPPHSPHSAPWRAFAALPSLLWFHGAAGLSVDAALTALAAAGLALALAVLWGAGSGPLAAGGAALPAALAVLWLALLSARSVGQGFLAGPW